MRIKVKAFGCKLNQCEAGAIERKLVEHGHKLVTTAPFDALIVCGCTVTSRADFKVRQYIRRMHREYCIDRIILAGCSAMNFCEADIAELHVHKAFTTNDADAIANYLGDGEGACQSRETYAGRTRGFVKIQDGCNQFCSYCIVPHVRGRERSENPDDIVKRVKELHSAGVKEVVLTGVHDGRYSHDGLDLAALCRKIIDETEIFQIRLSSIEPTEITDELLDLLANSPRIAKHLHVPLQSGSDKVLARMRRPYNGDYYKNIVKRIHSEIQNVGIGADVIVGFPGETDEDFENTYELIESLPLSYLHVFRYSKRKGTDAAGFPGQAHELVKRERMERLVELREKKRMQFAETQMGIEQTVIVEAVSDDNKAIGWTSNYLRAIFISPYVSDNNVVLLNPYSHESGVINCDLIDIVL